jgi:hypothetical protein
MAHASRDYLSAWENYRFAMASYRQIDDERVLVFVRVSGRVKTSGVALEDVRPEGANLFHPRDGKVTRLVSCWDRDRALADLGLEE